MTRFAALIAASVLLTACGVQPTAPVHRNARAIAAAEALAAAKANPWMGLKTLKAVDGAPSDGYPRTRRHLDALTPSNGRLWVLDLPSGFEVLHNTQQVTNAKKLAQIADALEAAAKASGDGKLQAVVAEYVAGVRGAK